MKAEEMKDTIQAKNKLIINQTRRITLLENKLDEVRKRYFQLKHSDVLVHLKSSM
jgi:hypothetical protein